MMPGPHNLRATGDRIEQMLEDLEATADPKTYDRACELLRLVADLYGAGLGRVLELVDEHAPRLRGELVLDDLVASLLVVHGLHPESLARRVGAALAQVRPLLAAHAGDVELLGIDEEAASVRVRLLGSCDGCPSSSVTLQMAVERAIAAAAPEVLRVEVDQPSQPAPGVPVALGTKPAFNECPVEMTGA